MGESDRLRLWTRFRDNPGVMLWGSVKILLEFDPEPFALAVSCSDMLLPVTQING